MSDPQSPGPMPSTEPGQARAIGTSELFSPLSTLVIAILAMTLVGFAAFMVPQHQHILLLLQALLAGVCFALVFRVITCVKTRLLAPLANSITVNTQLGTLAKEESFSYVEQRLTQVGGASGLFTQNALSLTHQASGGIMRSINAIAQAAMMKAYLGKSPQVEAEHVQSAIER